MLQGWKRSFTFAAIGAVAALTVVAGPAQAVPFDPVSIMEWEGVYVSGGPGPHDNGKNVPVDELTTAAWSKSTSGCCTLGPIDDTLNIIDANSALLGDPVELIGKIETVPTGAFSTPNSTFIGTTMSGEHVASFGSLGAGWLFTVDFTGANLDADWQVVKLNLKAANLQDGLFVTTNLFTPTEKIQQAFVSDAEYVQWQAALGRDRNPHDLSHFSAFGIDAPAQVPEPSTLYLVGVGLASIGFLGRRLKSLGP